MGSSRESNPSKGESKGHIRSVAGTAESTRPGHDGRESLNHSDDSRSTDPKPALNPRPNPPESIGLVRWLDALNAFLDRALKADIDTGC